jgi:hypothetical protein
MHMVNQCPSDLEVIIRVFLSHVVSEEDGQGA